MALTQDCLINGNSYVWNHIDFPVFGTVIQGITAISYKKKQEKTNNYGRGKKPVSRGRGKEEYEASITVEMKESEWMRIAAGGSLLDIKPFNIPVTFSGDGVNLTTHTLIACEFLEAGIETEQGSTNILVTLPLLPGDIKGL
ncbi:hypothetical protein ACR79R_21415 [Sphingobacterium spiritivorum]|uniref:hypothetical protein n=1 Tax=Sphingobacterium spiritivorum TaxID=258 RepID=UPI003DA20EEA